MSSVEECPRESDHATLEVFRLCCVRARGFYLVSNLRRAGQNVHLTWVLSRENQTTHSNDTATCNVSKYHSDTLDLNGMSRRQTSQNTLHGSSHRSDCVAGCVGPWSGLAVLEGSGQRLGMVRR